MPLLLVVCTPGFRRVDTIQVPLPMPSRYVYVAVHASFIFMHRVSALEPGAGGGAATAMNGQERPPTVACSGGQTAPTTTPTTVARGVPPNVRAATALSEGGPPRNPPRPGETSFSKRDVPCRRGARGEGRKPARGRPSATLARSVPLAKACSRNATCRGWRGGCRREPPSQSFSAEKLLSQTTVSPMAVPYRKLTFRCTQETDFLVPVDAPRRGLSRGALSSGCSPLCCPSRPFISRKKGHVRSHTAIATA